MTIAAAFLTSEGVVFGADSTTTVQVSTPAGQAGVVQLLNHAQKVFEVGENSRFGVCTYGAGMVGALSHRSLVALLADRINQETTTISEAVVELKNLIGGALRSHTANPKAPPIGYMLGGWNPGTREPQCVALTFDGSGTLLNEEPLKIGAAKFAGQHEYFGRVFRGYDVHLPELLFTELVKRQPGLPADFKQVYEEAFTMVAQQLCSQGHMDLPIREALDFVHTHLQLTVKAYKFRFGAPSAGGPIEIGFITTDRRFRWACHKHHRTAMREQEFEP